jgi:hypothetical protein
MIPPDGSHVKILLRNNTIVEGIVKEWYGNVVKLQSLDDKSYVIIPHPEEDIVLIKVLEGMPKIDLPIVDEVTDTMDTVTTEGVHMVEREIGHLESQFEEAQNLPTDDPDKAKTLARLRILMAEQEKKIISEKVRNHYPTEAKKVEYGYPGFFKKPGTK